MLCRKRCRPDDRTVSRHRNHSNGVVAGQSGAPSVHNSQPWRWKVGDQSVHLYADPTRHLPRTDPDQRDLLVDCGTSYITPPWHCRRWGGAARSSGCPIPPTPTTWRRSSCPGANPVRSTSRWRRPFRAGEPTVGSTASGPYPERMSRRSARGWREWVFSFCGLRCLLKSKPLWPKQYGNTHMTMNT